jgi:hypothetical protein
MSVRSHSRSRPYVITEVIPFLTFPLMCICGRKMLRIGKLVFFKRGAA